MLNLTRHNFEKVRDLLLRRKREVEKELKQVEKDDPLFTDGLAESAEPGTESWLAEVHGKTIAAKENLRALLLRIQRALSNLRKGKYGKCEKCGKQIELQRLEAMPTATLCIACSKKNLNK